MKAFGKTLRILVIVAIVPMVFPEVCTAQEIKTLAVPSSPLQDTDVAFVGRPFTLTWIIEALGEIKGQPRVSIYRVLDSTVVPVEVGTAVGNPLNLTKERREVISHELVLPESDRPGSYLVRLSFLAGESEKVLSNRLIHAIPADFLKQRSDVMAMLIGFKDPDAEGRKPFLESCGWRVNSVDEAPAKHEADLLIFAPKLSPPVMEKGTLFKSLDSLGGKDSPFVTILARDARSELLRFEIPSAAWISLPESATMQRMLANICDLAEGRP